MLAGREKLTVDVAMLCALMYIKSVADTNIKWNRAEYLCIDGKRVTDRIVSKCGRFEILRVGGEFSDFQVIVDGVRKFGGIDIDGLRYRAESLPLVRLAKRAAQILA